MKITFYFLTFLTSCFALNAQTVNFNMQTYPKLTQIKPEVQALVEQVNIQKLEDNIRHLQNIGVRDAFKIISPDEKEILEAQNWLVEQFEDYGLDVYVHHFPLYGDTLKAGNVVAIQYGTKYPNEYIIICSHYDAAFFNLKAYSPNTPGGADDNASGTSGVIEIARILNQYNFKRSIIYVPFNAEEGGVFGSQYFAQKCRQENMNILGVFNLDMIGYIPEDMPLTLYYSDGNIISRNLANYFQNAANIYLPEIETLPFTRPPNLGMGDDYRFNENGYPAIYIGDIENFNPCYHQPCDTLGEGVNNMELVQSFTKATLAAVVELANHQTQHYLRAIPNDAKVTVHWESSSEIEKYKLFRNDEFLVETVDTFYVDTDVQNGEKYIYYITGIFNETEESPKSNSDTAIPSIPLILPYFNDLENGTGDFSYNTNWKLTNERSHSGQFSLVNTDTVSTVRLRWFSIPDTAKSIKLSMYVYTGYIPHNTSAFVEITKDRKKWKRLTDFRSANWARYDLFLNEYIGEPFVEIRWNVFDYAGLSSPLFIDNIEINFDKVEIKTPKITYVYKVTGTTVYVEVNWDLINIFPYFLRYNVYRNGEKTNDFIWEYNRFREIYDETKPAGYYCYQVSAVYLIDGVEVESELSEIVCYGYDSIEEISLFGFSISPNPTSNTVNISTSLEHPYTVAIYGLDGVKILQYQNFVDGQIDLSSLAKGIYFINISTGKSSVSRRVVLE